MSIASVDCGVIRHRIRSTTSRDLSTFATMVYSGYDDEYFYDHFNSEMACLLGMGLWPLCTDQKSSIALGSGNLGCQNVSIKALSSSSSSSLTSDEFSYPRYYFMLVEELNNDPTHAPTTEDIMSTAAAPAVTVATDLPADNGNTSMPPSNGLGVSTPLTLRSQAAIQAQAICDKHAKITRLGLHMPKNVALFMSMKDNLLDVRDTAEWSLYAADPKSP